MTKENELRVWHIPQVPGKPFKVSVNSPEEAVKILDILAEYDDFQFRENIKPDYSSVAGLEIFEEDEWTEWYDDDGNDIGEFAENIQDRREWENS